MLDLTALDKLQALAPDLIYRWRTKRTPEGWKAQCTAGFADYITPCWQASGATEQEALDRVVGYAFGYWAEFVKRQGEAEKTIRS